MLLWRGLLGPTGTGLPAKNSRHLGPVRLAGRGRGTKRAQRPCGPGPAGPSRCSEAASTPRPSRNGAGAAPGYQFFESRGSAVLPAASDREAVSPLPGPSVSDQPRWPRKDQKPTPSTYPETSQNVTVGVFLRSFQSQQRGRGLSRRLVFSGDAMTADTPLPGRPCPASQPHGI